jgi:hypothetical protein
MKLEQRLRSFRQSAKSSRRPAGEGSVLGSPRSTRRQRAYLGVERLEDRSVPATFTTTTFADGVGIGSLRDAVLSANADTGTATDTILLNAGMYHLTIQNTAGHETAGLKGDLNITNTKHQLIILGNGSSGPGATTIDPSALQDRAFQIVNPGITVFFENLVIQGGKAQDNGTSGAQPGTTAAEGGAILANQDNVTLNGVVLSNNVAQGGNGANGPAGAQGGKNTNGGPGGAGGAGQLAAGGGIYIGGGSLTITGSTLTQNQAIGGKGGTGGTGGAATSAAYGIHAGRGGTGGAAQGGGVYTSATTVSLSTSTISSNTVGAGAGGTGGAGFDGFSVPGSGGRGGDGGVGLGAGMYVNGG